MVYQVGDLKNNQAILDFAKKSQVDFAVIGPEGPLANGLVDDLLSSGIKSVGPLKELAQVESSKSFTRELLEQAKININPEFMVFESMEGMEDWIEHLEENFVIKPDGLTGGKGVKVSGDHFNNMNEGLQIIKELLDEGIKVIVEEKLIGQEFSLMTMTDGTHFIHLPAVQDNKRVNVGDFGPNTGGMGSYSCADFSLPFLNDQDIIEARIINEQVAAALKAKTGQAYKGILYGNFIAVKNGLKLIEYNARFGDPEAMNVLTVLKSDFAEICQAVANGSLDKIKPEFYQLATVCKYAVPEGYPADPVKNQILDTSLVDKNKVAVYYAAVDQRADGLYLTGSRAVAIVAKHQDLFEAEKLAEEQICKIKGPVFHRPDIGTKSLIDKRVEMMKKIRSKDNE